MVWLYIATSCNCIRILGGHPRDLYTKRNFVCGLVKSPVTPVKNTFKNGLIPPSNQMFCGSNYNMNYTFLCPVTSALAIRTQARCHQTVWLQMTAQSVEQDTVPREHVLQKH